MLVIDDVYRTYRAGNVEVDALCGATMVAEPGTMTAVMGPSGCGKSTLMTVAGGLQLPDRGDVRVAGTSLVDLDEDALIRHRRTHVGSVFQDYNLVQLLTAIENVALPGVLDGVRRGPRMRAAGQALRAVGMERHADRYPDSLSGGQQQRVALARVIVGGAERLVLADEPTGALDSNTASEVLDVLAAMLDEGLTCVIATHDAQVAARAHRVVRMRDGRLLSGESYREDDGR